jgi:endonuclease YncB( thermonuclease family)
MRSVSCECLGHTVQRNPPPRYVLSDWSDQYGRTVAVCFLGEPGPDIGKWLVANGFALDWPQYSKGQYAEEQRGAEKAGRGIWRGSFVEPWKYRACRRSGSPIERCSDGD